MKNDKLTQKSVAAVKPGPARVYVWDTEEKGFGLVVQPNGLKSFTLRYYTARGRRQIGLGRWPAVTTEKARERARAHLALVAEGGDPLEKKAERAEMPTYAEWVAKGFERGGKPVVPYLDHVAARKRAAQHDVYYLRGPRGGRGHVAQDSEAWRRWHKRPLDSLTTVEVQAWFDTLAERGTIYANRALASLRASLAHAVRLGVLTDNAAVRVCRLSENQPRARVLSPEERARLTVAVDALPSPWERALFRLLLETGCRLSEALGARWADLDLTAGRWTIPSPKAGTPQTVPLVRRTVAMLRGLGTVAGNPYLFPGRRKGSHRTEVRGTWETLRLAAGVADLNIHDLRRSYGLEVAKAAGILAASKLLRHSDTRITSRVYAPLGVEDLRAVAERVVSGADVVPFKGKGHATG